MRLFFQLLLSSFLGIPLVAQDAKSNSTSVIPLKDPSFFPIAVWLQNPNRAGEYKAAGINTYVALWHGPTEEQIKTLEKAGMHLVCSQNSLALQNRDNPMILAWMHGDEPDNAQ